MTNDPNEPDGIDTTGSAVPPYEGRRATADMDSTDKSHRDGAEVGGATGPVVDETGEASDGRDTPGGSTGSPADEQPATHAAETDVDDDRVGPAHQPGTSRAEDQP